MYMKKLLFGIAALSLLISCSGNSASEKANEDSTLSTDSIVQLDTADSTTIQAEPEAVPQEALSQESVRQDSVATNQSLQANSVEVEKKIKDFYEGAVLLGCKSGKKIPWTKSALSKYCTKSFIKKMEASNEYDDGGIAVWILRNPDIQDSDPVDKVISVEVGNDDTVTVTYLDCGVRSKTKLYMKNDNGSWKINNCKFLG